MDDEKHMLLTWDSHNKSMLTHSTFFYSCSPVFNFLIHFLPRFGNSEDGSNGNSKGGSSDKGGGKDEGGRRNKNR
ncbi:hypothetical protein EUGRSUZ_F00445 [Eucalyptus grandis]|uniref:Uncharacterized protein n=2 Tax=Eucalyptus grandis TaxID=71139 RepID=A0ACC3KAP2_EUCGR|nr:hypothetical protein EUGRSUZ_F00445 [Eucalyptus grandis]